MSGQLCRTPWDHSSVTKRRYVAIESVHGNGHAFQRIAAFAVAPLASSLLLAILFSIPASPLFLDKLADPSRGSWFAFNAILFDGTILAYLMELMLGLPVYFELKSAGRRAFAESWLSPGLGCVCGLLSTMVFNLIASRPKPVGSAFQYAVAALPVIALVAALGVLLGIKAASH